MPPTARSRVREATGAPKSADAEKHELAGGFAIATQGSHKTDGVLLGARRPGMSQSSDCEAWNPGPQKLAQPAPLRKRFAGGGFVGLNVEHLVQLGDLEDFQYLRRHAAKL